MEDTKTVDAVESQTVNQNGPKKVVARPSKSTKAVTTAQEVIKSETPVNSPNKSINKSSESSKPKIIPKRKPSNVLKTKATSPIPDADSTGAAATITADKTSPTDQTGLTPNPEPDPESKEGKTKVVKKSFKKAEKKVDKLKKKVEKAKKKEVKKSKIKSLKEKLMKAFKKLKRYKKELKK